MHSFSLSPKGYEATIMFYPNELVRYRNTNFPYPQGLQIFKPGHVSEMHHFRKRLLKSVHKFGGNSFHGMQYIWLPHTRPIIRTFWISTMMAAISACLAMYTMLTYRHGEQLLVTVVETARLPIYSIPFPAVAVCPYNHVNWIRYQAAEERFLPHNTSEVSKNAFYELLAVMESISLTSLRAIGPFVNTRFIPRDVQDIVLYNLAHFMAFRCDEIFTWCNYDHTEHDCCKIFVHERTERGICLVFNSVISEESRIKQVITISG